MKVSEGPIVLKYKFSCSKEILWRALTELHQMQEWFFPQLHSFDARVGFQVSFDVFSEDILFVHQWKVVSISPLESMTLEWNYKGIEGNSEVCFDVSDCPEGSNIKLTHKVLQDFKSDLTQFKRESRKAGWNYLIKESLANFLKA